MIHLTKKEAIKFHEWMSDIMISNHKWEILQKLDKIIGYCPNKTKTKTKKKDTVHGGINQGGPGEGQS